MTSWCLLFPE